MADELKPCPFCGGNAETRNSKWVGRDHWGVACTGCGDPWFDCRADTEAEAITAWNTRTPEPAAAPGDEALERFSEPFEGMLSEIVQCHQLRASAALKGSPDAA